MLSCGSAKSLSNSTIPEMKKEGEAILQTAWHEKLYSSLFFTHVENDCTGSEPIEVLFPGELNRDGGPDFRNALIRIGSLIWAGNVEVHRYASEWYTHKHHLDPAYDSVILHVILHDDALVTGRTTKQPIFTCRMTLAPEDWEKANRLLQQGDVPRCFLHTPLDINSFWGEWSKQLYTKRLARKVERMQMLYEENARDWAEVIHLLVARYLGSHVNNEAFEQLARSLPLRVIRKHTDSLPMLEALYFGQAALLRQTPQDAYEQDLLDRYQFLKAKYQLTPLPIGCIRLLRLRPSAFPHRRIAQLAALHHHHSSLEGALTQVATIAQLRELLNVSLSPYWQEHYTFANPTQRPHMALSMATLRTIFLNLIVPFPLFERYVLGDSSPADHYYLEAYERCEAIKPEKNSIIERVKALGLSIDHAAHSQAALELWEQYCVTRECYVCPVGKKKYASPIPF